MKNHILIITLIFVGLVFSTLAQTAQNYYVSVSYAKLRQRPTADAEAKRTLKQYDNLIVLQKVENEWLKVSYDLDTGYILANQVCLGKAIYHTYYVRTGAQCRDGSSSSSTGSGTCSHHGGVAYWLTNKKTSIEILKD
ncbi:DUF3761 domain-containing protein [bacterium]|nr:DUF3761 domain-containing protein [bacterium]